MPALAALYAIWVKAARAAAKQAKVPVKLTVNGTPQELRKLMGELEEIMDELQFIDDNNPNNPDNKVE